MDKDTRTLIFNTTQAIRRLLEEEFALQLEGTFDVHPDGRVADQPGPQLTSAERLVRQRIVEAIQHRRAVGESAIESVRGFQAEAVFTFLNRLPALKMMEARGLVLPCVSQGVQSQGFKEFSGLAPGLIELPDRGYRLYLECLFDEIGREVGVLFDRTDAASQLWPRRKALEAALEKLNNPELAGVWGEDETIGWIYQYYNDPAERKQMREESAAPRNSRELAVRNQFFTPRYVVEFLTDNTLGRIWYEMTKGRTSLRERCRYLVRRPNEVFLGNPNVSGLMVSATSWVREVIETANFSRLPDNPKVGELSELGLAIDGYSELERRGRSFDEFIRSSYNPQVEAAERGSSSWQGDAFELWCALFAYQRATLRHGNYADTDTAADDPVLRHLWPALRSALLASTCLVKDSSVAPTRDELLKQPVFIPHRPLKDPRTILMLDPACGSMHFGLYAFDLFEVIYGEARAGTVECGTAELRDGSGGFGLERDFPDLDLFRRHVPRLIIEFNIHGIDIDPRATQIAGLALWLRAQKAWQKMELKPADRPAIKRSNIVCAEPMPGEKEFLREFVDRQFPLAERSLFLRLLETIWDKMQLAGEAGSLLKIEDEIRSIVATAKRLWKEGPKFEQGSLFSEAEAAPRQSEMRLDLSGITDEQFWERAEDHIYAALRTYAEQAGNEGGFQRRLFAEDAARGFAFIDLCRKRYDVALMNPPFGDASFPSKPYIDDTYGDTKGDVYKAFVECFHARLVPAGYLGIISSRAGFFLSQSEDWRTRVVLRLFRPIALADLGSGVLDAMVEVAAYVLRSLSVPEARDIILSIVPVLGKVVRDPQDRFSLPKWQAARDGLKRHQALTELEHLENEGFILRCPGDTVRYTPLWRPVKAVTAPPKPVFPALVCVKALEEVDKGALLHQAIQNPFDDRKFICDPGEFVSIPSSPFAYSASRKTRTTFERFDGLGSSHIVASGTGTLDDFRFLRLWLELPYEGGLCGWFAYAKGGAYSPFYFDQHLSVNWAQDGAEMKAWIVVRYGGGQWSRNIRSTEYYFRPGITWPRRSQRGLSIRTLPTGCIFGDKGPAAFDADDRLDRLLALLALTNASVFRQLVSLQIAFGSYEVGVIQRTPIPSLDNSSADGLTTLGRSAWSSKRALDTVNSTSHAFLFPALLAAHGSTLAARATAWAAHVRTSEETVAAIQAKIDDLASRLYDLDATDRAALTSTLATEAACDAEAGEDEEEEAATADATALVADLLAYPLGCAFGRWDIRYATGEQAAPELPDPFAPLPVCPPGQLQNAQGLPARPEDVSAAYPVRIPWDGILVDDPGHPLDIERRVREVIGIIWGRSQGSGGISQSPGPNLATPESIEHEACEILRVKSLRDYFRKPAGFFADHLKRYSKSRRQAPIYWPLSSPNGLYTVWLYYHRLTPDTLFTVQRDHLKPKLEFEEGRAFQLRQEAGATPSPSQRRDIAEAEELVEDLRAFIAELERVAPLFRPNLNDGVIINHAPLWRMIGLPKWRKDCQAIWNELVKGDYDWAHLALHLWPERVIPKCATDRSLAIAHGLDEVFWMEDPAKPDKWIAKKVPTAEVQALIAARSVPAVKAALDSLTAASGCDAASRKGKKKGK